MKQRFALLALSMMPTTLRSVADEVDSSRSEHLSAKGLAVARVSHWDSANTADELTKGRWQSADAIAAKIRRKGRESGNGKVSEAD
ncbi:MAG TPA: hypothetical protein VF776_08815 [Sphingomicrobium sp.]